MEQLSDFEIEEVSGGINMVSFMFRAVMVIGEALYNSGLNAREAGQGDAFLEAVRGGNMGA